MVLKSQGFINYLTYYWWPFCPLCSQIHESCSPEKFVKIH